jgi:amino acid efflux transporter
MKNGLGLAEGSALYIAAVLGTGILVLPATATAVAGPAALLALAILLAVSVPLASAFASLGARHPDPGGISTYVRQALGTSASTVTAWWFYLGVPVGIPALVLFGAGYVQAAAGGGRDETFLVAGGLLALCVAANAYGVRLSGRVQLGLTATLVVGLLLAVSLAETPPGAKPFESFVPFGWSAVGPAVMLLLWSLTGWEAVTHLGGEFNDARRDIPRATTIALVVIAVLFGVVTTAVVLVLGTAATTTSAPIAALLGGRLGRGAVVAAAALAVVITLGGTNAYLASLAKLGSAMGRDGTAPAWLAPGSAAGGTARRSLTVVTVYSGVALIVTWALGWGATDLVLVCAASQIAVYVIGLVAAVRILPARGYGWWCAVVSLVVMTTLLVLSGWHLVVPLGIASVALGYRTLVRRRGLVKALVVCSTTEPVLRTC